MFWVQQTQQLLLKLIQIIVLSSCSSVLFAQQFDQSYLTWKAQQQSHDQRLNASASANHYLGKPSLASAQTSSQNSTSKNAGQKVNINKASVLELQQLHGIGEKKAQAIVEYRNQNGQFKNMNDLLNIKGIGPKFIEKNRSNLSL
ncbi:ComEA family DNA-binding protein [Acinetobacter ihumii]|uniref:ComEA family DNA-binding protein n=1 Tax=Acinetobacter ihumii TaxID=2483802 RepID=UPI00103227CD|nr:helix-hairpin-helix domain-containing protein [Acinetobacter ihumii]